ncbi:tailspike contains pectin lyase domain [Myxococcus phage Mx1]|nr:tailspike contains pectin lyase domain [Myxococcus phage Mx1]
MSNVEYFKTPLLANGGSNGIVNVGATAASSFVLNARVYLSATGQPIVELVITEIDGGNLGLKLPSSASARFNCSAYTVAAGATLTQPDQDVFPAPEPVEDNGGGGSGEVAPPYRHDVTAPAYGAVGDGVADDTVPLQNALAAAKADPRYKEVFVPAGTYRITLALKIASGVTLRLSENAKILKDMNSTSLSDIEKNVMLKNDSAGTVGLYGANSNIRVIGGIWDCNGAVHSGGSSALAFGHCSDVLIENVTITNVPLYHHIEMNSSQRVRIVRCKFYGGNVTSAPSQAIQIDGAYASGSFPWFGPFDNTPCKNVVVEDCYFDPAIRLGVGTHSSAVNVRHSQITIRGCQFDGQAGYCITPLNWEAVLIEGNTFTSINRAISWANDGSTVCEGLSFIDNRSKGFNNSAAEAHNVFLVGGTSTRLLRYVTISGNILDDTGGYVLRLEYVEHATITGNTFSRANGARGVISTLGCQQLTITGNSLNVSSPSSILLSGTTSAIVSGNIIRGSQIHGVEVLNATRVRIVGNTILDCGNAVATNGYGVFINTSTNCSVSDNTISQCTKDGIRLSGAVNVSVTGNFIDNVGTTTNDTYSCIFLTTGSNNCSVLSNTCRTPATGNRTKYGVSVGTADCNGNFITNNDLLGSGVTSAFNDAGTGTVTVAGNRG